MNRYQRRLEARTEQFVKATRVLREEKQRRDKVEVARLQSELNQSIAILKRYS